jgi:hypothetical protein
MGIDKTVTRRNETHDVQEMAGEGMPQGNPSFPQEMAKAGQGVSWGSSVYLQVQVPTSAPFVLGYPCHTRPPSAGWPLTNDKRKAWLSEDLERPAT